MRQQARKALCVAIGAAVGGVLRHAVTGGAVGMAGSMFRVCAVNVAGSFVLGGVNAMTRSGRLRAELVGGLGAGFCGGLTTFSTFVGGVLEGGRERRGGLVVGYVVLSFLLGVGGVAGGEWVGNALLKTGVRSR